MKINIPKLPIFFQFIIFLSIVEVLVMFILSKIGFGFFQLVPYLRIISLFFVFVFILKKKLFNLSFLKISLLKNNENNLVVFWFLYAIFGFFIGVLNNNPKLYLVTDFAYIVIGFVLFRIFQTKYDIQKEQYNLVLSKRQNKYLLVVFFIITAISFFLEAELPSFFIVFIISYSLYLFFLGDKLLSLLYLIPFFLHVLKANRSILIVFILAIGLSLLKGRITKRNIIVGFFTSIFILGTILFFSEEILFFVIQNLEQGLLKNRINQLYLIASGKINWNAPNALSLKQRFVEAELVMEYCFSNPFRFLFGAGNGGTIEGFTFKDTGVTGASILGKEAVHNIHLLPFSLFFRYGFFGLIIFILLIKNSIKYFFQIIFEEPNYKTFLFAFALFWIIYSIPAASFLWTCSLFWITLGIISKND